MFAPEMHLEMGSRGTAMLGALSPHSYARSDPCKAQLGGCGWCSRLQLLLDAKNASTPSATRPPAWALSAPEACPASATGQRPQG